MKVTDKVPSSVTLTGVRCSGCDRKFQVVNIESQTTMECPHCHEKYFLHGGTWHNEKMRELVERPEKPLAIDSKPHSK